MTQATSVRFDDHINKMLTEYVKVHNISKSEFIQKTIAEKLEDLYDVQAADLAFNEWKKNDNKTYSHKEMMKKYD
jgi:predicted DNA-binding protein